MGVPDQFVILVLTFPSELWIIKSDSLNITESDDKHQ